MKLNKMRAAPLDKVAQPLRGLGEPAEGLRFGHEKSRGVSSNQPLIVPLRKYPRNPGKSASGDLCTDFVQFGVLRQKKDPPGGGTGRAILIGARGIGGAAPIEALGGSRAICAYWSLQRLKRFTKVGIFSGPPRP